jgi:hypothetical protein
VNSGFRKCDIAVSSERTSTITVGLLAISAL